MAPFINVEEEKSHVSPCVAAQVSESHENEALPDDGDAVLQQPKERKTIRTFWQGIKSTHRTKESGGLSALNRENTSSCVWSGLHAFELHGQHVHQCRNQGRHRGHALRFHKMWPDGLCLDQNRPPESLSQDISAGDGVAVDHLLGV